MPTHWKDNLNPSDIYVAYRKLKAMAYYDNHDLFLRSKIADFETDLEKGHFKDPKDRLEEIYNNLPHDGNAQSASFWDEKINEIDFYALPKEVKTYSEYNKDGDSATEPMISNIFTNQREVNTDDGYHINKLTLFINAPIEIYLISVLWIMKLGYRFFKLYKFVG